MPARRYCTECASEYLCYVLCTHERATRCLYPTCRATVLRGAQKHLRWTMDGPDSSYSCLEIHICWKVDREDRMEPPIQTEYLRSGGAMILTFMEDGARAVISFCMRSAMPVYMVVPPDMTMLPYSSLRMSTSHFMME